MTPDDQADRLAHIAQELMLRVRDDDPQANAQWLIAHTSEQDRWALLFILAAAVPDDRPWSELVAWLRPRRPVARIRPSAEALIELRRAVAAQALNPRTPKRIRADLSNGSIDAGCPQARQQSDLNSPTDEGTVAA